MEESEGGKGEKKGEGRGFEAGESSRQPSGPE